MAEICSQITIDGFYDTVSAFTKYVEEAWAHSRSSTGGAKYQNEKGKHFFYFISITRCLITEQQTKVPDVLAGSEFKVRGWNGAECLPEARCLTAGPPEVH